MDEELKGWMEAHDLVEFEEIFVENRIDLKTLKILTEADLKELGLPFGPRKRILNAVAELKVAAVGGGKEPGPADPTVPGERRHLTVMFCDLVGSTPLSDRLDQEDLHVLIKSFYKTCSDVILDYEGYVATYLGDGLLIYFGWPAAHEDAAERCVRAGLEMVQAVKSMRTAEKLDVRIGIATGAVVVGEAPRDGKVESGLVVGKVPNLAARLQGLAGQNEIVIAHSTRRLVGNIFSVTPLGPRELKGIEQPEHTWRVDGVRRAERRFDAVHGEGDLAPLIGRGEEIALLEKLRKRAWGGEGQVVVLGGQPGIGKSRLTQGIREGIDAPHADLHFQCSPYHLNSPLFPFIEHFEYAAGFAHDDTPGRRLEKLEAALAGDASQVAEAAPLFAALHSLPMEGYEPLNLLPQKLKEKTLEAIIVQIEAAAYRVPALVVVEDIHWIDPTSLELLNLLVERVRTLPVILVMTHRLEYAPPWTGRDGVTTVVLDRLGRLEGAQMIHVVTSGRALPPAVLDEILARTDGVPLFVEELTKAVLESGQLREEGDHYALVGQLDASAIPESLRDLLTARLDRLGTAKEFAQIGACIGREFSHELLERLWKLEPGLLGAASETLVAAELITRHGSPPAVFYRFKHALIQDAAYDSLLRSTRRKLHSRIACVLESDFIERVTKAPEWLAHHHTEAGNLAEAIPLWRKAGSLAVGRVALKEAIAHFQKGLTLIDQLPPSPQRDCVELTIREPLNAAWTGLYGWAAPEVGGNATAVLHLAERQDNAQSLMLAMWWMWTNTITQGRISDSFQWVERLLAEGSAAGGIDLRIFGHATAMVQYFLSGHLVESREQADRALALWDPKHAERWVQLTGFDMRTFVEVYTCQLIWMMGYPDQAMRLSDGCVADARSGGHVFNLGWALPFSAYVFAYRREPGRFLERVDEADQLAREQGLAFIYEVSVPQAKGIAELLVGRPGEAARLLRQGISRWTKAGGHVRIPLLKSALAEAVAQEGDLEGALELIEECLEQIGRPSWNERLWLPEVLRCKGWILMLQGRDEEAEGQMRAAVECANRQQAKSWELRGAITLARFLAERGRREEAHGALSPVLDWFTEGADTRDHLDARALLDNLASPGGS